MARKIFYACEYVILLLKEVVAANVAVARIVLSRNMDVSPAVVSFESRLKSDFLRTILANSITLTPGTITIDMQEGKYTVHCLREEFGKGLGNSRFEEILLKIEGMKP
ncbi:hypothetical protein EAL2_808p03150 (plasmid) [Peptoclostridium acidaminophilum DSM 3953]|uniref:Sodium:proton antiporter n=1 Tax=Peptoclostridium acidaminophilum DSM 3953 TaxID=1286171 RepID=W8TA93_PEPAC|nr:Na+/H+ antiporter subunit E [Peptoclostridium acidaminophilum]AHM57820.1 hypothetical protein EAL2_808p03150 [Peptoclostridium acidaminophilum DSM 3953]